jgi:hypothetical protein
MAGGLDIDQIRVVLGELAHPALVDNPAQVAALAAVGLTRHAWRDTHLEDLHAGSHPSGGFPDADMMRFNIATTRVVAVHFAGDAVDWQQLADAMADRDRELPGGLSLGELAGDEYDTLADDIYGKVGMFASMELTQGRELALGVLAFLAAQQCREWYGTPWWPQLVEEFIDRLDDPGSDVWRFADPSAPAPPSVADRVELKGILTHEPEALDDDAIYWCLAHDLSGAANAGLERWRSVQDARR